jgi:hypothetical protein
MRKDSTSRKLRTLKLSRETLYALSSHELQALGGGISLRCEGTAACTESCGANSCAYTCAGGYLPCTV